MYFLRPHDLAAGQYTRRRIPIPLLHGLSTTVNFVFRIPENFYSIQYSRGRTDPHLSQARRKVLFTDNENISGTLSDVIARYGQSLDRDESAKRHLRGITCCTRCRSSPSHFGFRAVPSNTDVVLNNSNSPRDAAFGVLARIAFTWALVIGRKLRAASNACSRISMLSMPVITTEVGKFRAYRTPMPNSRPRRHVRRTTVSITPSVVGIWIASFSISKTSKSRTRSL